MDMSSFVFKKKTLTIFKIILYLVTTKLVLNNL